MGEKTRINHRRTEKEKGYQIPDLWKNRYNHESLSKVAHDIQAVYPQFQAEGFLSSIMDETWDGLELKDRIYRISENLRKYLPEDYGEAIGVIDKVVMNYGSWLSLQRYLLPIGEYEFAAV